MGFFDRIIKKTIRNVTDKVSDGVADSLSTQITGSSNHTVNVNANYDIPSKYSEFPKYPGAMSRKPVEKSTSNYERIRMSFNGGIQQSYINELKNAGYNQSTNVRFDKGNTYVIVEPMGSVTEVVFHIKK